MELSTPENRWRVAEVCASISSLPQRSHLPWVTQTLVGLTQYQCWNCYCIVVLLTMRISISINLMPNLSVVFISLCQKHVNKRNFTTHTRDRTWTAAPIDSSLISQPYLMEYILAFLPSYAWSGRSCYTWQNQLFDYKDSKMKYTTSYTGMPCAQCYF